MKNNIYFIHGLCSFSLSHILLFRNLSRKGFNIFYSDLPGHGSKKEDWEKGLVAFKQICKFVISDIKQKLKGEKFSIISHSMGSAIVSVIFKKNRKQIEKIIFINPFTPMNPFLKIDKLDNLPQPNKNFLPSVTKIGKEYNLPKKNQKEVFYNWLPQNYKFYLPLMLEIAKRRWMRKINKGYCFIGKFSKISRNDININLITSSEDKDSPSILTKLYFQSIFRNNNINYYLLNCGHNPVNEIPQEFIELINQIFEK